MRKVSDMPLTLRGDDNNEPMPLTDADVNHLRRLLAWIRLEHKLDEHMMRGLLDGAERVVTDDPSLRAKAQEIIDEHVARTRSVPKYIRQAVKMLSKAVSDHDATQRVINQDLV